MFQADLEQGRKGAVKPFAANWRGLVVVLPVAGLYLGAEKLWPGERAMPALSCAVAMCGLLWMFWRRRKSEKFWIALAGMTVAQVPVALLEARLTGLKLGKGWLLLALLDWIAMVFVMGRVLPKVARKRVQG